MVSGRAIYLSYCLPMEYTSKGRYVTAPARTAPVLLLLSHPSQHPLSLSQATISCLDPWHYSAALIPETFSCLYPKQHLAAFIPGNIQLPLSLATFSCLYLWQHSAAFIPGNIQLPLSRFLSYWRVPFNFHFHILKTDGPNILSLRNHFYGRNSTIVPPDIHTRKNPSVRSLAKCLKF